MSDSGARGNVSNFTQLVGMRGLMTDTKGEIKEIPIKSSFREGLSVSEYFISTHGARKGMADMALKTADSGYLTRRLVDVSQEVVVLADDCFPAKGFLVSAIIDTKHNNVIVPLKDRLVGRYSFEAVEDEQGNVLVEANELITEKIADSIVNAGIKEVNIRSVLTCDNDRGVCKKCYGINLATSEEVRIGEPVGVIAAQSVGEPGTQLTMRNFHTGGVAGNADITQGLPRIKELLDVTTPKGAIAKIAAEEGEVVNIVNEEGINIITVISINGHERTYRTQFNSVLRVGQGDHVKIGQKLTEGSIDIKELLEVASVEAVENYILKEVQKVYRLQGIEISDKYIEIIIKQMLGKVKVIESGETDLLPGEVVSVKTFNDAVLMALENNKRPPLAKRTIFGIKKAPLESDS
jgi:DNA-directed RNA polymerase subunit beta'